MRNSVHSSVSGLHRVRRALVAGVWCCAWGLLPVHPAVAAAEELERNPEVIQVTLHRSLYDQVGPSVDVGRLCGPTGAAAVEVRQRAWQSAVSVMTLGLYTPTTARVLCGGAREEAAPSR